MMRTISLCFAMLLLGGAVLSAQEPEEELKRLLQTSDPQEMRSRIDFLKTRYRGTAFAYYVDALVEPDAERAYEKFQDLIKKYPTSKYAGSALFRVAQFHFSRGLYISARREFLEFAEKYPRSHLVHDARYFALASLCAVQRDQGCFEELKKFVVENANSPYLELAKEDLAALLPIVGSGVQANGESENNTGEYTLQIGAFSQVQNAHALKKFCEDRGLDVQVKEARIAGKVRYLVWLGAFETEKAASEYGLKFREKYGKPFRVVRRN